MIFELRISSVAFMDALKELLVGTLHLAVGTLTRSSLESEIFSTKGAVSSPRQKEMDASCSQ